MIKVSKESNFTILFFLIGEPLGTCETLLEVGAKLEQQSGQRVVQVLHGPLNFGFLKIVGFLKIFFQF